MRLEIGEQAAEATARAVAAPAEIKKLQDAAAAMGVRGIPALFIFKDGEVVSNIAGARPKAALQSWIDAAI